MTVWCSELYDGSITWWSNAAESSVTAEQLHSAAAVARGRRRAVVTVGRHLWWWRWRLCARCSTNSNSRRLGSNVVRTASDLLGALAECRRRLGRRRPMRGGFEPCRRRQRRRTWRSFGRRHTDATTHVVVTAWRGRGRSTCAADAARPDQRACVAAVFTAERRRHGGGQEVDGDASVWRRWRRRPATAEFWVGHGTGGSEHCWQGGSCVRHQTPAERRQAGWRVV